jgi:hypothetical protein
MKTELYVKYSWIVIITALLVFISTTPSTFQKGGLDNELFCHIVIFVVFLAVFISLNFTDFHWVERVLVSIPFAFLSSFVFAFIVVPKIVYSLYGYKTWLLDSIQHRLFINFTFYALNATSLILLLILYFNLRGRKKILHPSRQILSKSKLSNIDPNKIIYAEVASVVAMGKPGCIMIYTKGYEKKDFICYEVDIDDDEETYLLAEQMLNIHSSPTNVDICFYVFDGGMGNSVYINLNIELRIRHNFFICKLENQNFRIFTSVPGVFMALT